MTKIHLHEIAAVLIAIIVWTTIGVLAVIERDIPEVLTNGGFAALAYVFGTRASTTLEHLTNGQGGPSRAGPTN